MHRPIKTLSLLSVLAHYPTMAIAEPIVSQQRVSGEAAIGSNRAWPIAEAKKYAAERMFDNANAVIDGILLAFEPLMRDNGFQYRCFSDEEGFRRYVDAVNAGRTVDKRPVVRVDPSYARALHLKGWIASELQDWDTARELFGRQAACRPFDPGAYAEIGYVLNKTRQSQTAYETYRRAYEIAVRYAASKSESARALRGMGCAMIDMGDLDRATDLYQRSLRIEPDNDVALHELRYIETEKIKQMAKHGSPEDQCTIGLAYATGAEGFPRDIEDAAKWFSMAAVRGSAEAQYCLGVYYADKNAAGKDPNLAEKWLRKACRGEYERACQKLKELGAETIK